MKKVNKNLKKAKKDSIKVEEDVVRKGEGKFNFPNGDCYEGEYIIINNKDIFRHGMRVKLVL